LQQKDPAIEPTVKKTISRGATKKDSVFLIYGKKTDNDGSEKLQAWTHPDQNLNKNTQEYTVEAFKELLINALPTATVDFANSATTELEVKFIINGESFVLGIKNIFVENQLNKTLKDNFRKIMKLAHIDGTITSEVKKLEHLSERREKARLEISNAISEKENRAP
jgi:hypothetical protein